LPATSTANNGQVLGVAAGVPAWQPAGGSGGMGPVVQGDAITSMEVGSHMVDAAILYTTSNRASNYHEWAVAFSKPMPHVPEVFTEVDTTSVVFNAADSHEPRRVASEVFKVSKTGFSVRIYFGYSPAGDGGATGMFKLNWLAISRKLDEHIKLVIPGVFDWPTYEPIFTAQGDITIPAVPAGYKFVGITVFNKGGRGGDSLLFLTVNPEGWYGTYNHRLIETPPGSGTWKLHYHLPPYDLGESKGKNPNGLPYQIEAEPLFTGHDVTSHYDGPAMTKGMYSMDEDGNKFYWDGTKWVAGVHP
jgi:hypothetical protein